MGDENPIRTLGDYSKPSHEGYMNIIEIPVGNNVGIDYAAGGRLIKLRLDESWAAIERLAQYKNEGWNDAFIPDEVSLNYENPNIEQLLGIMERKVNTLMKDAISLMGESESIFRLTTNEMYLPPSEPSRQEEFEHIVMNFILDQEKRVRQLEDYMRAIAEEFMEFSSEVARRRKERIKENKNKPRKIEKITKYLDTKVLENSAKHDPLENLKKKTFPTSTNLLCVRHVRIIPLNPPQHQKNTFGFNPGERTNQSHHSLSNSLTIQPPTQNDNTFMVNDPIKRDPSPLAMRKIDRSTRGQASSSHEETMEEKVRKFGLLDNGNHQMNYNNLASGDVVDWEFLSNKGVVQPFFDFINTDTFFGPQLVNLFQINEPIFQKLVREFFASFEFDATPYRYEPLPKGVTFRLGGVEREMSLLEFGWRVGLYSEGESRDVATLSGLRNTEMVNATRLTHSFWPSIGDGMFNVGNKKAQSIRNPRIKLAHRCITMTITGRKETTNRVTEIDLFYLYCIFGEGVVCNIPYWLAKYLKSVRDKSVIFRGMFVTRIARSFGLLTNEMVSVLNREPPLHVYRKTSLVKMGVIMELHEGECYWPATREVMEEGKGVDEEGDGEGGNEGVGGSADIYRNMSQRDWQVHQAH
ncbi:hypothetical protein Tco_1024466 [Tanacetum coccineum]